MYNRKIVDLLSKIEKENLIHSKENISLLDEIKLIKSGKYFITYDPYTEKADIVRLQEGVNRGLYTQDQLDSLLSEMKTSDTYLKLRNLYELIFMGDHTPFASIKNRNNGLNDYGFHVFIGREIFDEGHECFVTLDVRGGTSYTTLDQAVGDLFRAVEKGRKVLLSKSPGRWVCPPNRPTLASRTYFPFNKFHIKEVKRKFEANPNMKNFDNPFNYQPK